MYKGVRALLLAAGLGTRLRPLTDQWPKCLMPICKRPLLEYWLHTLYNVGVQKVLVNTHFHADQVNAFLDREQFSSWVKSVYEPELLGTAGSLRANFEYFNGHTTLLIHADNWCICDFGAFLSYHLKQRPANCLVTMMTFDTNTPHSCGVVETDDQGVVVAFHEKVTNPPGKLANAAVYLLEPQVIEWLRCHPEVVDFSAEVIPQFIGRIATWHNTGILRDIGTLPELRAAQNDPMPQYYWTGEDEWQKKFRSSSVFADLLCIL